jgi:enoyl-CoA hydratase/carnithine racemase
MIPHLPIAQGLAAESAVYSMLQGSNEFRTWRGNVEPAIAPDDGPVVVIERSADTLTIMLNRPHRHNAISRQLRDELCAALGLADTDRGITRVELVGHGPSFCSGGDLGEFGGRPDPALAHITRLAQSPARLIHTMRSRTTVHVHGATLGGGIEMAAFAGHLTADPATRIGLPEVGLGLIPGAGGTVSITARIGRQRTAALSLAIDTITTETAHDWGLIDGIEERPTTPTP